MKRSIHAIRRPFGTLHVEVTQGGDGDERPALIFAHGLGGNHMSWFQQVAHFAPTRTCVAFAHRGFLPSSPIPGGPDPADYAADLAAIVETLGIGAHHVVAQSMGGWTALEYALTRPAGLRGVVLAATTGTLDPQRLPASDRAAIAAWEQAAQATRARMLAGGIHPAAGLRLAEEQPAMHLLYQHINDANLALDKEALRLRLGAARRREPAELAGVACPVLLIANEEDTVIAPPAMAGMARAATGVRFATIERAAHSAYFERPAVFNALVEAFIAANP
jgi:pimeloyl-ACP methyl ester carboxylesterase